MVDTIPTLNTSPTESNAKSRLGFSAILGIGLVLAATIAVVWQSSLDGVFLFDDYGNIVNQERIDHLWPPTAFLTSSRPFGLFTLAVNKRFCGGETFGYHLFNLAVHSINALLIYVGILLSRAVWLRTQNQPAAVSSLWVILAALVSLFWAIHPLTTQAVTYIVQRYESLSAMGYLGAWVGMLIVIAYPTSRLRLLGYLLVFMLAWIGLASKEVFATAPLAIILFDRQITGQSFRSVLSKRWLAYGLMLSPFIWFSLSVSRWFDPTRSSSMGLGMKEINSWEYLRTQPEVILHYFKLTFWPHPLCIDYVWRIQHNPMVYLPLGAVILVVIAVGFYFYTKGLSQSAQENRRFAETPNASSGEPSRSSLGLVGWGILTVFFILAPTSSVMPIADLAFEHRFYLPLALVVAGVVFGSAFVTRRLWHLSENHVVLGIGYILVTVAIAALLGWRTHLRNLDYHDELVVWMKVTNVAPENPRGWYNAGSVLYKRGHHDTALPYMVSAVGFGGSKNPPMYDIGLGDCLRSAGRIEEALFFYRRAVKNNPEYAEAHNNLGVAYSDNDDETMAQRHFEIAVDLGHIDAMYNLAMIFEKQSRIQDAIELLKRAHDLAMEDRKVELAERIERRLVSIEKNLIPIPVNQRHNKQ